MRLLGSILLSSLLAAAPIAAPAAKPSPVPSLASELRRLHTSDHLYLPQSYRLHQYSGFSRAGGNPDRFDYLYRDGDWLVYADVEGPGIVSRIWTTHGEAWQDIRIELDGRVIYEGGAGGFFGMNRAPFVAPLCQEHSAAIVRRTAEGETGKRHVWGASYVPMPFQQRFRFSQKSQLYANVNVKRLPAGTKVRPFPATLSPDDLAALEDARRDWQRLDFFPATRESWDHVTQEIALAASSETSAPSSCEVKLSGPAIIREIRLLHPADLDRETLESLTLHVRWDDATEDAIAVPLDVGLGSLQQRTLALGFDGQRTQFIRLPMPFEKSASLRLVSRAAKPIDLALHVTYENVSALPSHALYLHGHYAAGQFISGKDSYAHPNVPAAEFLYHNGFTALDVQGAGHVVAYLDRFDCQPELDEHVFIDDERTFPENTWNGTGHEDLFDMAWGHKMMSTPMTSGGGQTFEEVNVKLFWNDPMTFRTALRFNWEWSYKLDVPPPRDARFRSVVYYYTSPKK
jgi:Protein of unknown function (DUF2961).